MAMLAEHKCSVVNLLCLQGEQEVAKQAADKMDRRYLPQGQCRLEVC